ncbi:DUF6615 family protein [Streptacidiphilus sp. P02-A3a]|uniref:DUF6615 family protein n=1 Tax=Streptacidiphilus sp. P02-A3a TaxID=2704468 RepID=UPI0015FBC09F|nr:DUF6615 family protein [Streptacidiphilus sp. P02-A3a]QMU72584.1 hypothetical protein GXP74_34410 [Streptacidiphilus sp. P02-A3a]
MTDSLGQSDERLDQFAGVLLDRCRWVHKRLLDSDRFGVNLQEETLTEDLLLDIAMEMAPFDLKVEMFSKPREGREGADWEWWFGGRQWFGVRVQAKRLRRIGGRLGYDLDYRIGRGGSGPLQVEVFRDRAREAGLAAAYVFYNGPVDLNQFWWDCDRLPREPENFGVSVLPVAVARALVQDGTVDFGTVANASHPWPCLVSSGSGPWPFGCGFWPFEPPPWVDSPDPVDLDQVVARRFFALTHEGLRWVNRPANEVWSRYVRMRVDQYCRAEPPDYVRRLLEGGRDIAEAVPPEVGAISVFCSC